MDIKPLIDILQQKTPAQADWLSLRNSGIPREMVVEAEAHGQVVVTRSSNKLEGRAFDIVTLVVN